MAYSIKSFGHGGFNISQSFSNLVAKTIHADHPLILSLLSAGAAICTYQVFTRYSPGGSALAAVAGVSALLLIGFAIESSNFTTMLFNLLTAPLVFALAYASLSGPESLLIASFAIQALVVANQIVGAEKELKNEFYCLTLYHASLVLLLI